MGKNRIWLAASVGFIFLGLVMIGIGVGDANHIFVDHSSLPFTPTPEPLVPTRTVSPHIILAPTQTLAPSTAPLFTTPRLRDLSLYHGRTRWGIGVANGSISRYNIDGLRLGWYLDWQTALTPAHPGNIDYAQMVRLTNGTLSPSTTQITQIARANPGALWLIGNEPDVRWQDNTDPSTYARLYAQAYQAIKVGDATAQVAIGGVSEPTPLRLKYLQAILDAYRQQFNTAMPIDVWNIHNFILREERGTWGVDIPPGMLDDRGILYEVDDSGNLAAFKKQIVDFRLWMAEHGYRNYPLVVSEYGIPMPEDYGFPPERVATFLIDTFDFLNSARDTSLGDPADDSRLVQRWCWYSLNDSYYATGRLFDGASEQITVIGTTWVNWVNKTQP